MQLQDYDLVVINTSGGKDSQTMLRLVSQLADAQEYPRHRLIAVHADLGRVEWGGVRDIAEAQALYYGIQFMAISRPQGDLLEAVEARGMWPSATTRYCTSDHKRDQVSKIITGLHKEFKRRNGFNVHFRVLNCMGFRAQESAARAKRLEIEPNKRLTTQTRTVTNWHPVLAWSESEVWADIKASQVPYHPAYDRGMPRLSCVFCIFAPKSALMIAGEANPALLDEYVALEEKMGHTFRDGFRIGEIKEALARGERATGVTGPWNM